MFNLLTKLYKSNLLGSILVILLIDIVSLFIKYSGTPQDWTSKGYSSTGLVISTDSIVGIETIFDIGEGVEIILSVEEGIELSFFKIFSVFRFFWIVWVGIGLKRLLSSEMFISAVLQDMRNSKAGIIKLCFMCLPFHSNFFCL